MDVTQSMDNATKDFCPRWARNLITLATLAYCIGVVLLAETTTIARLANLQPVIYLSTETVHKSVDNQSAHPPHKDELGMIKE